MKKNFKLIIALVVILVLVLIGSGSMWVPKVAPNTTNPVLKFIGGVDFLELQINAGKNAKTAADSQQQISDLQNKNKELSDKNNDLTEKQSKSIQVTKFTVKFNTVLGFANSESSKTYYGYGMGNLTTSVSWRSLKLYDSIAGRDEAIRGYDNSRIKSGGTITVSEIVKESDLNVTKGNFKIEYK